MAELTDEDRLFIERLSESVAADALGVGFGVKARDNDWMLIIKLHALIEAALNSVLLKHLGAPELERVIAKLDTSNTATGKVAFAKALKILTNGMVVFIQRLSELRNLCVHDVRNFDFDLNNHFENLPTAEREGRMKVIEREVKPHAMPRTLHEALVMATMNILMHLRLHQKKVEIRDLQARLYRKQAATLEQERALRRAA